VLRPFITVLETIIRWMNANQGFAQVLLTIALVVATIVLARSPAKANAISRDQMKQALELEQSRTRPYLSLLKTSSEVDVAENSWCHSDQRSEA